jgi:thiol:disulfide interchange protein DsbA
MRFMRTFLLAMVAGFIATSACASPAEPKNGVEYLALATPQPTDTGKKIEVIEFFAYYCPHCNALEPKLAEWVKSQGANIAFKRVHVERGAPVAAQQRLFLTLEAMGLVDQYQGRVFDAMHKDGARLSNDEEVFAWAEKAGINRVRFIETYRAFSMPSKINRAHELMGIYHVDRWPFIAIDGHYVTSPSHVATGIPNEESEAVLNGAFLQVADFLVAKAKAEKK